MSRQKHKSSFANDNVPNNTNIDVTSFSTGAYVAGETFSVVTNVVEGDGIVTITIGGVEYALPLDTLLGEETVAGKSYVVWSYCRNNNGEYENSDITFVKKYYSHVAVNIAEPVASWNDADLSVSVDGVENFHLMVMPKMMFDDYSMGYWSEEALQMFGGRFTFRDVYMPGKLHFIPGKATLINPDEMAEFAPGEELVACVFPLDPSKANADYSFADVVTKTFKLAAKANDSAAALRNVFTKYTYNIVWCDVPECGLVEVTYTNYSSYYKYSYAIGCNWDANGNVVSMSDAFVFDATTYAAQ